MNNENEMHWTELWPILFRFPLAEDQAKHLRAWLKAQFGTIGNSEMCAALDAIAEPDRKAGKAKTADAPTGLQIKSAIIRLRSERKRDSGGMLVRWNDRDARKTKRIGLGDLREMIRRADPEGRWDIICDVLEREDHDPIKHELEAFADTLDGGVDKYVPKPGAFSGPRATVGQAFDATATAPAPPVTGAGYMPGRVSDEEGGWL